MKKLAMFALLAVAAVGCTSGVKQSFAGETYTRSSMLGSGTEGMQRPVQAQPMQQQAMYPVAE